MSDRLRPELEIYIRLHLARVRNIAGLAGGGDVIVGNKKQLTLTQKYLEKQITERGHTRLVTSTIGLPLEEYRDSKALVYIMYDIVRGAYSHCISGD